MNTLEEILEDIEWRKTQLLIAKTLPFLHTYSFDHKVYLIKYSIPTIYAIWEGFVQNSFQIYIRELNKLNLTKNEFCINILTHTIDAAFPQLKEYPNEFIGKMNFVDKLDKYWVDNFTISSIVNTESNIEIEVLNRLCLRFNLNPFPKNPFKLQLQDLLRFRNRISHGDINLIINQENIEDFTTRIEGFISLIEILMELLYEEMLNAFNVSKSYLKSTTANS